MKTTFLALSVLGFTALAASGQSYNARNPPPAIAPAPGGNTANGSGAEYAAVRVAPVGGGIAAQGTTRRAARQQARMQRRAEYVAVSVAPRR